MPLTEFFAEQFQTLRDFFVSPKTVVQVVYVDPDLRELLIRALVKMQDEENFAHLIIPSDEAHEDHESYTRALASLVDDEIKKNSTLLSSLNVAVPPGGDFLTRAAALADALPDHAGSVVFLVEPGSVADPGAYARTIETFANECASKWLKFLCIETRTEPRLKDRTLELERVGSQTFFLSPEEIEKKAREALDQPEKLDAKTHRQHLALVAGFAAAKGDSPQALQYQTKWIELSEKDAEPGELASALYNQANSLASLERFAEAEEVLVRAGEICIENDVQQLLALVLTNLGVTLFRQGRNGESEEILSVARKTFHELNNLPGEAHVFSCLSELHRRDRRNQDAEEDLLAALALYDGMQSSAVQDVQLGGRGQVLDQLELHFRETAQTSRLGEVEALRAGRSQP